MNEDVMQDVMQIVGDMLADPTCEISCEIGTTRVRDYTRGEVMHTPDTHRKTLVIKIGGGASQVSVDRLGADSFLQHKAYR